MNNIFWISLEEAIYIQEKQIETYGGDSGINNLVLLESALESPQNHHYYQNNNDILYLGSIYLYKITKNHSFIDGNKRTATEIMILFLLKNGYIIDVQPKKILTDFVQEISGTTNLDENIIYDFIKKYAYYYW